MKSDITAQNRLHWIVQGGEFFLPRVCLMTCDQKQRLYLGLYTPDPQLAYDKMPLLALRDTVDKQAKMISSVDAAAIRTALDEAGKKKLIAPIAPKIMEKIIAAKADLETFKPSQMPYLADYFCQVVLGGYFAKHKKSGIDCVEVRYAP
jgi:hypothetical protein